MNSSPTLRGFVTDALERIVFTFAETFLALYTPVVLGVAAGGGWHQLLNLSLAQKGVVAGVASVLVIVKSLYKGFVVDVAVPGFLPNWVARFLGMAKRVQAEDSQVVVSGTSKSA